MEKVDALFAGEPPPPPIEAAPRLRMIRSALLIAAPALPEELPIAPTLGPEQLRRLAGRAPLNTDDAPWIEFEAPKWVNRPTATLNQELVEEAAR